MDPDDKTTNRITQLESSLMHLQNDFESLNEVVLRHGRQLDELNSLLKRLTDKLETKLDSPGERNLEDEVPPHY